MSAGWAECLPTIHCWKQNLQMSFFFFSAMKQHFIHMQLVNDSILYIKTIHITIYKIHNSMGTFFDWGPEQQQAYWSKARNAPGSVRVLNGHGTEWLTSNTMVSWYFKEYHCTCSKNPGVGMAHLKTRSIATEPCPKKRGTLFG